MGLPRPSFWGSLLHTGESSQSSRKPMVETPHGSQTPKPTDAILSPNPRGFSRARPGSASSQWCHSPYRSPVCSCRGWRRHFQILRLPANSAHPGEAECAWACTSTIVKGVGGLVALRSCPVPVGSDVGLWPLAFISSIRGTHILGWRPRVEAESLGSPPGSTSYLLSLLTPTVVYILP